MEALKDLTYLDISYNMLSNMDGMEYLIKLKTLKIHGNKVDKSKNVKNYYIFLQLISKKFTIFLNVTKPVFLSLISFFRI